MEKGKMDKGKYEEFLKDGDRETSDIIRLNFKKNPSDKEMKYGKGYDAIRRMQKKLNSKGIHLIVGELLDGWIMKEGKKYGV